MPASKISARKAKPFNNPCRPESFHPSRCATQRIRKKISGTPERPRLAVHFSGKHIYAQVIDDDAGKTLASANTTEKDFRASKATRANVATADQGRQSWWPNAQRQSS